MLYAKNSTINNFNNLPHTPIYAPQTILPYTQLYSNYIKALDSNDEHRPSREKNDVIYF